MWSRLAGCARYLKLRGSLGLARGRWGGLRVRPTARVRLEWVRGLATASTASAQKLSLGHRDFAASVGVQKGTRITPVIRQWLELKEKHPEYLLLFRMGDFYEMLFDDAPRAAQVLSIALTKRTSRAGTSGGRGRGRAAAAAAGEDDDVSVPMCGIPHHALPTYLKKLISHGVLVAIVDQVELPEQARARGGSIVRRDVTRLVTPGTLVEDMYLNPRQNNFLASVAHFPSAQAIKLGVGSMELGLAWADISTGELQCAPSSSLQLAQDLARVNPSEVLISEELLALHPRLEAVLSGASAATLHVTERPTAAFTARKAKGVLPMEQLEACSDLELAAMGGLFDYVSYTQRGEMPTLSAPQRELSSSSLVLDTDTRRSLELTSSIQRAERKGGLLGVLDRTSTPAGSRLLASRMRAPLTATEEISARLDLVELFYSSDVLTQETRRLLGRCYDLERSVQRLSLGKGGPRDLRAVAVTLRLADELHALLSADERFGEVRTDAARLVHGEKLAPLREKLARALVESPPLNREQGGFVADGFDEDLDRFRVFSRDGKKLMQALQAEYREQTGISSLKIRFNNVLGYFVEVSSAHGPLDPRQPFEAKGGKEAGADWPFVLCQRLRSCARYKTERLSRLQDDVNAAADQSLTRELELFEELRTDVLREARSVMQVAYALSDVDVGAGLGTLAREQGYTRPEVLPAGDEPDLCIENGRHAVVEVEQRRRAQQLGQTAGEFEANDCRLGRDERLWLITGPNMAGKSTFLRQTALICVMAQLGSFVPADAARFTAVDRIFSRVGATDDIARDKSTFMVEMLETAGILRDATPQSLVIMDEIGRGTSTFDGLALAMSVCEHLHSESQCRTLFATHYHELHHLQATLPRMGCYHMAVEGETGGELTFVHRVLPGVVNNSYGVAVARLAGVDERVVQRAEGVLAALEQGQDRYRELVRDVFRGVGAGEARGTE